MKDNNASESGQGPASLQLPLQVGSVRIPNLERSQSQKGKKGASLDLGAPSDPMEYEIVQIVF